MKAYKIKIKLEDTKILIWRTFIIPAGITFKRLHDVIQIVMGWNDMHLFRFKIITYVEEINIYGDDLTYDMHKEFPKKNEKTFKSKTTKIDKYLENAKKIQYEYDFGDSWFHNIELKEILENYEFKYPQILKFKGNCPPEDCGGVWGYEELLELKSISKELLTKDDLERLDYYEIYDYNINDNNSFLKEFMILKK